MEQESPYYLGTKDGETSANALAALTKGTFSLIPGLGPVLGEVVGSFIPNMRLERVVAYLQFLQSHLSESDLEKIKNIPPKIALLEEGILAAGLSPHAAKVKRIAHVVTNGITKEEFDADHHSHILRIVRELSDAEAIILQYYGLPSSSTISTCHSFQSQHPEVWPIFPKPKSASNVKESSSSENMERYNVKKAHLKNYEQGLASVALLERLNKKATFQHSGLRNTKHEDDIKRLQDAIKNLTAEPTYQITQLGLEVLDAIKAPLT